MLWIARSKRDSPPNVAVEQRACSRERHMQCGKQLRVHNEAWGPADF